MTNFQNILVYVDQNPKRSDIALRRAAEVAQVTGGRVTVLDVIEAKSDEFEAWPESDHDELRDFIASGERAHLEERTRDILGDIEHTVVVQWGRPSLAVIQRVLWARHDLVIKVARGRESGRRLYFGTTAMHLIRKCPCPVWIAGAELKTEPTVIAAIDPGAPTDIARAVFARRIVQRARKLAAVTGARLHVVAAWDLGRLHALRVRRNPDAATERELAREQAARDAVSAIVDGDEPLHIERGRADEVVPRLARELHAHTIVMGSVGRTGISGLLIGEMAEEILSRVDCGVLCVKPDGFVCPVRPAAPTDAPTDSSQAAESTL